MRYCNTDDTIVVLRRLLAARVQCEAPSIESNREEAEICEALGGIMQSMNQARVLISRLTGVACDPPDWQGKAFGGLCFGFYARTTEQMLPFALRDIDTEGTWDGWEEWEEKETAAEE